MGFDLTAAKYVLFSASVYARPVHPVPVASVGANHHETIRIYNDYKIDIRLFLELMDVKKVILKYIVYDIDEIYFKLLHNRNTNTMNPPVPDISTHFFDRRGINNYKELQIKESNVREMIYDLTESIIKIFNELEGLQDFGTAANNDYSNMQLINFAIQITKNTGKYEYDIKLWNAKLQVDKTWDNLKTYFEDAHKIVCTMRGKTMKIMAYHHTNMLAIQVLVEVKAVKENMLQKTEAQPMDDNTPPHRHDNSSTSDNVQIRVLKLFRSMQDTLRDLKSNSNNSNNTNNGGKNMIKRLEAEYTNTPGSMGHVITTVILLQKSGWAHG